MRNKKIVFSGGEVGGAEGFLLLRKEKIMEGFMTIIKQSHNFNLRGSGLWKRNNLF